MLCRSRPETTALCRARSYLRTNFTNGLHIAISGLGGDHDNGAFPARGRKHHQLHLGGANARATRTNITFQYINTSGGHRLVYPEAMPARLALRLTNGVAYIQLTGGPGRITCRGSTNFNWTALSTNNPVGGTVTISDSTPATLPWRFYPRASGIRVGMPR